MARSSESRTARASQPLGQAMPRLTGYSTLGVRLTAFAVFERNFESATGGAEATDGGGGGIGDKVGGDLAKAEFAGFAEELFGVGTGARVKLSVLFDEIAEAFLFGRDGHGFCRLNRKDAKALSLRF